MGEEKTLRLLSWNWLLHTGLLGIQTSSDYFDQASRLMQHQKDEAENSIFLQHLVYVLSNLKLEWLGPKSMDTIMQMIL